MHEIAGKEGSTSFADCCHAQHCSDDFGSSDVHSNCDGIQEEVRNVAESCDSQNDLDCFDCDDSADDAPSAGCDDSANCAASADCNDSEDCAACAECNDSVDYAVIADCDCVESAVERFVDWNCVVSAVPDSLTHAEHSSDCFHLDTF